MFTTINDIIHRARIRECCRKHYEIFFSACLAILFVVFMSKDTGDNFLLLCWVSITTAILTFRFIFVQWFANIADNNIHHYHINLFVIIMFVWGISWGTGTMLFFPALDTLQQAAWFAMFMVMIAASATSHSVYMPAFFAFSLPFFAGILWVVATIYPSEYHFNAIILTLVMITQIGAAKKGQKVILESLRLRYENSGLIESLKKERDSANKANNAKSKFLAAASHDLRQPLHALTLFSAALENSITQPDKCKSIVGKINDAVDALQSLFNALLDISRLDAGTLKCEKANFSSHTLFEKLAKEFAPVAEEKQVKLAWDLTPTAIHTDPTLFEIIIRNLVSNALRYTTHGEVKISLTEENERIRIDVVDTGIGIETKNQAKIFEEFVQLHNPERDRNKGLGLGLSIVKRLSTLLGTTLSLESELGKGTRFSLSVTKGTPEFAETPISTSIANKETEKATVLVIDDESSILEAMQSLLTSWGYEVLLAPDESKAKSLLEMHGIKPTCILADYRLREYKTGIEAIDSIRELLGYEVPAAIITGDIAQKSIQDVKDSGLEMLSKPLQPAMLRSFIRNSL